MEVRLRLEGKVGGGQGGAQEEELGGASFLGLPLVPPPCISKHFWLPPHSHILLNLVP